VDTALVWTSLLLLVLIPFVLAGIATVFIQRQRHKSDAEPPVPVKRPADVRPGDCDQLTEVWHVIAVEDVPAYFVASCQCEWAGPARDAAEPDACDKATADAYAHGANVAPNVVRPLG
jgi:hypothetical protein